MFQFCLLFSYSIYQLGFPMGLSSALRLSASNCTVSSFIARCLHNLQRCVTYSKPSLKFFDLMTNHAVRPLTGLCFCQTAKSRMTFWKEGQMWVGSSVLPETSQNTYNAIPIMKEHLRANWLAYCFHNVQRLIPTLSLEGMKEGSISLLSCSLSWGKKACKYFH